MDLLLLAYLVVVSVVAVVRAAGACQPAGGSCWRTASSCVLRVPGHPAGTRAGRAHHPGDLSPASAARRCTASSTFSTPEPVAGPRPAGTALGAACVRRADQPGLVAGGARAASGPPCSTPPISRTISSFRPRHCTSPGRETSRRSAASSSSSSRPSSSAIWSSSSSRWPARTTSFPARPPGLLDNLPGPAHLRGPGLRQLLRCRVPLLSCGRGAGGDARCRAQLAPSGIAAAGPDAAADGGVVYCQMHYGVDALGGLAVGLVVTWLVGKRER